MTPILISPDFQIHLYNLIQEISLLQFHCQMHADFHQHGCKYSQIQLITLAIWQMIIHLCSKPQRTIPFLQVPDCHCLWTIFLSNSAAFSISVPFIVFQKLSARFSLFPVLSKVSVLVFPSKGPPKKFSNRHSGGISFIAACFQCLPEFFWVDTSTLFCP